MRLPGTGVGVARLVLVSMVKVDMAPGSSALTGKTANPACRHGPPTTARINGNHVLSRFVTSPSKEGTK